MAEGALETLLKRDRLIVAASLASITVLAWVYLFWISRGMTMSDAGMSAMSGMDMPGMDMSGMDMSSSPVWSAKLFMVTLAMWAVMMAGMMTPSASPMILLYARVARQATLQGKLFASTGWFAGGYLLSWSLFSLAATGGQYVLDRMALLTPSMSLASQRLGGVVFVIAGIYQWTPLKDSCLRQCRSPLSFIQQHGGFKPGIGSSLGLGLRHGLYCIGCCWALMALLFAGGVMNLAWVAALAALVLIEKLAPVGRIVARIAGIAAVAAGAWLLYSAA
jgi:predicted metal-binding membrane protein